MNLFQAQIALQKIKNQGFGHFEIRDHDGWGITRKTDLNRGYLKVVLISSYSKGSISAEELLQVLGESQDQLYKDHTFSSKRIAEMSGLYFAFQDDECIGKQVERIVVDLVEEHVILLPETEGDDES